MLTGTVEVKICLRYYFSSLKQSHCMCVLQDSYHCAHRAPAGKYSAL